jgi:hypothetical protein
MLPCFCVSAIKQLRQGQVGDEPHEDVLKVLQLIRHAEMVHHLHLGPN